MMGLIDNAVASSALALPTRPPFLRLSIVSRTPNTRVRSTSCPASVATSASASSSSGRVAASSAQARAIVPRPSVTVRLSITRTVMPSGATERAANSALCSVADSAPDNITATMCVDPRAASAR